MASEKLPEVAFFPALRLAGNVRLGEWIVGTPPADVLWRSPRFKELARSLLSSFADRGFHNAALVWHRERGVDGVALNEKIALAVEKATRFAMLDANDHIGDRLNKAHNLTTSENATLYIQPIQEGDGSITHLGGGFWRRTLTGGWHIGERPLPLPETVSATLTRRECPENSRAQCSTPASTTTILRIDAPPWHSSGTLTSWLTRPPLRCSNVSSH